MMWNNIWWHYLFIVDDLWQDIGSIRLLLLYEGFVNVFKQNMYIFVLVKTNSTICQIVDNK